MKRPMLRSLVSLVIGLAASACAASDPASPAPGTSTAGAGGSGGSAGSGGTGGGGGLAQPTACAYPLPAGVDPYSVGDCDGAVSNGCETDLLTALDHCGACGHACDVDIDPASHRVPTCSGGVCETKCAVAFADCDGEASNGCETDVQNDAASCGSCGFECYGGSPCVGGRCEFQATPLHESVASIRSLSSDGTALYFWNGLDPNDPAVGQIVRMDPEGGAPQPLVDTCGGPLVPMGDWVVFVDCDYAVARVPKAGGPPELLLASPSPDDAIFELVEAGGALFLLRSKSDSGQAYLGTDLVRFDPASGTEQVVFSVDQPTFLFGLTASSDAVYAVADTTPVPTIEKILLADGSVGGIDGPEVGAFGVHVEDDAMFVTGSFLWRKVGDAGFDKLAVLDLGGASAREAGDFYFANSIEETNCDWIPMKKCFRHYLRRIPLTGDAITTLVSSPPGQIASLVLDAKTMFLAVTREDPPGSLAWTGMSLFRMPK